MRLTDSLRAEHRQIEQVAGALVTCVRGPLPPDGLGAALDPFCRFFEDFVDGFHHAKEEGILLPALLAAQLPERGPIAVIREEHVLGRSATAELRALADESRVDESLREWASEVAMRYCALLWEHIDKEDSVLFVEVETRLALEGIRLDAELSAFEATRGELASLASLGAKLVETYPPAPALPGVMRGAGCVLCRRYGDGCDGVEREWWSELEWEGFHARVD